MLTIAVPTGRAMPPVLASHPAAIVFENDPLAALRANQADAALVFVRSQSVAPDRTLVAAVVQRPDPQAMLFTRDKLRFKDLPPDSTLATTEEALRRQIAAARPESPAPTIIADLDEGLAAVERGSLDAFVAVLCGPPPEGAPPSRVLASKTCLHAPLDGIAVLIVRAGDEAAGEAARTWHDPRTEIAMAAERALLETLASELGLASECLPVGGDCSIPGAYHCVKAVVAAPCEERQREPIRAEIATETTVPPEEAGEAAARALLEAGAAEFLRAERQART